MIHHQVWFWLEEINDLVVPGPGQLIGFDVKRDIFTPVDLIPVVGPLGKLYKGTKLLKHGRKVKYYIIGGIGIAADVFAVKEAVEWYNSRYRTIVDAIVEEESSSPSRSGNADEEISGGGGTTKPKRYHIPVGSKRAWKKGHNPCDTGYYPRKIKGKWYCVRK